MKRFLALVIATMLIVGMLPNAFAAETTGNGNEWIFTSGSHGYTEDTRLYTPAVIVEQVVTTPAWAVTTDGTETEVSDKWGFSNQAGLSDNFAKEDFIYMNINVTSGAMPSIDLADPNLSNVKALSLNLTADTSGEFTPCLTYVTEESGGIYEIYLVPDSEKILTEWTTTYSGASVRKELGKLDVEFRIGKIDAYGSGEVKTIAFPKRSITAGNYHLVVVGNGVNEEWKGDTTIMSGRTYVSLKLVSFAMKDSTAATAPFYKYDITTNALSDTFYEDYSATLTSYSNVLGNGMLRYISWKTSISGVETPAIDTEKTDAFALTGRGYTLDTSPTLYNSGFASHLKMGAVSGDVKTFYFDKNYNERPFCLMILNVPVGGKYKVTALNAFTEETAKTACSNRATIKDNYITQGTVATVHMVKADVGLTYAKSGVGSDNRVSNTGDLGFSEATKVGAYDCRTLTSDVTKPVRTDIGTVDFSAGEYYIFFDIDPSAGEANSECWTYNNYLNQLFLLSGIELTPVAPTADELETVQNAYDAIVNEDGNPAVETKPTTGSKSFVKILSSKGKEPLYNKEHTAGDTITYTATGDDFLYWAQGIGAYRTAISDNPKLSIKAEKGAMYIYAVYAKDSDTTEVVFYNGNKAEISRKSYADGATIEMETLPSMAGFKDAASAWICVEDGKEYTAENPATASGKLMRFVAKYPDVADETFNVTAVNGTADKATVTYGETVTVTAPLRKNNTSTLLFNYWEKDGEIVSFDESYSFRVYKDTTVTAVYKEYQPLAESVRKIILGTRTVGNETAVIAEFINVTGVTEKGIMFGGTSLDDATHKVAMKGTDNFFSVIHDVSGAAKGYAILSDGSVIYSE